MSGGQRKWGMQKMPRASTQRCLPAREDDPVLSALNAKKFGSISVDQNRFSSGEELSVLMPENRYQGVDTIPDISNSQFASDFFHKSVCYSLLRHRLRRNIFISNPGGSNSKAHHFIHFMNITGKELGATYRIKAEEIDGFIQALTYLKEDIASLSEIDKGEKDSTDEETHSGQEQEESSLPFKKRKHN